MNYLVFNIILIIITFCSANLESVPSEKQKWVDVSQSISKRCLQQVEKKFGLVAEGTGWTKQEGLKVPSYSFICYRKMQPEQALELYYNVISLLELQVRSQLNKKKIELGLHYNKIPLDVKILFLSPNGRRFYCEPCVAVVSIIKDSVIMLSKKFVTEPLQTMIEYPLKEFEDRVFGSIEEICQPYPISHQNLTQPMRYRRCSR